MKPPSDHPTGEIRGDSLYRATAFCRCMGWAAKSYRQAKRAGLRTARVGRMEYVLGRDAIAFIDSVATKQEAQN